MINRFVATLCGSLAATFALTGAFADASATAGSRLYHASRCRLQAGSFTLNSYGQLSTADTTNGAVLFCPIVGGSERASAISATTLVSAYANGSVDAITATKCFTSKGGWGGACGLTPDKKSGPGVVALNATEPSGGTLDDYYYYRIELKPQRFGSYNVLFGYSDAWN